MPQDTLREQLYAGYKRFRAQRYPRQKQLYEDLAQHGQKPRVMIIGCCDSRADPSDIFDASPGEMFVLRNVANMVPSPNADHTHDSAYSAIDYAVNVVGVKVVMVMGHESCGGINAAIAGLGDHPKTSLESWISQLTPPRDIVLRNFEEAEYQRELELEGVRQSVRNLNEISYVEEKVKSGELVVMGAYFSIIRGKLLFMNGEGDFEEVPTT